MNKKVRNYDRISIVMIVSIMILSSILTFWRVYHEKETSYEGQARIKLSELIGQMEQGQFRKSKYPYINYDLSGTVRHVNGSLLAYQVGDHVKPLEKFENHRDYYQKISSIEKNGTVQSITTFYIPVKEFKEKSSIQRTCSSLLPMFAGVLLLFLLLVLRSHYLRKRILTPMEQISESAQAMIRGNYDVEVQRVYEEQLRENEMGDLIYSFEMMRDELKIRQIREEELKKSSQELISCISHDLRTPIATIQAYGEGLRDGVAQNEKEQKDYVAVIIKKTRLLNEMIGELLEYSNAKLNHLSLEKKEIYFKEFYNRLLQELRPYVEHQGVILEANELKDDAIVMIDPKRILEVIYNLVDNSLKYKRGENDKIHMICEIQESEVWIKVKDHGIGISANDIPHVFDQFYRAEKSRSMSVKGSGLGLSICKYIVEQHGGEIYCRSRKNEGCEIRFSIRIS
ncbi:sensor histidine kinase [Lachnospiraceae bacterium KM106-2]|nr:sensor histidine kinase [Lachnospiraceae bacterium KM106-2]